MNPPTDNVMKPTQTHTPGPWRSDILDSYGRFEIRQSDGGRMFAQGRSWGDGATAETQEANARLIAAAPNGLAFAESFMAWAAQLRSIGRPLPGMEAREREASEFIARATGQP